MLSWKEYLSKGTVRKAILNKGMIKSLLAMADNRLGVFAKLKPDQNNASVLFTNYYDALREICEAIALKEGYKIYQHEAIGLFLSDIMHEDLIFMKFDRFRIMRNRAHYYGAMIPFAEAVEGIDAMKDLIEELKAKYMQEYA